MLFSAHPNIHYRTNKEKKKTIRQVICGSSFCVTGVLGEFP